MVGGCGGVKGDAIVEVSAMIASATAAESDAIDGISEGEPGGGAKLRN
jgi:hypothetical protein